MESTSVSAVYSVSSADENMDETGDSVSGSLNVIGTIAVQALAMVSRSIAEAAVGFGLDWSLLVDLSPPSCFGLGH